MAHTGKFATSSEITTMAGDYNTTTFTEAVINQLCLQAESIINVMTRYNWTDAWDAASLNVDVKYILSDAEACWVAIQMITGDMSGYGSQRLAETQLDVLYNNFNRDINILQDKKYQDFAIGA